MATDLAALKNYVTAADGEQFSRLPDGVVSINISHSNITARMIELKFDLHQTVRTLHSHLVAACHVCLIVQIETIVSEQYFKSVCK